MYVLEFKGEGFDVTPAFGPIDAIEKLRGGISPDAVLIDVSFPVMDGLDLLEVIRSKKLIHGAKVVILSDEDESKFYERGRFLEVAGHMAKASATPVQVVKKVQEVLGVVPSLSK